jgi:hypothetical protein
MYTPRSQLKCNFRRDWVTSRKADLQNITYFSQFAEKPVLPSGPHRPQISRTLVQTLKQTRICSGGPDPPNKTKIVETNPKRQRINVMSNLPPMFLVFVLALLAHPRTSTTTSASCISASYRHHKTTCVASPPRCPKFTWRHFTSQSMSLSSSSSARSIW